VSTTGAFNPAVPIQAVGGVGGDGRVVGRVACRGLGVSVVDRTSEAVDAGREFGRWGGGGGVFGP